LGTIGLDYTRKYLKNGYKRNTPNGVNADAFVLAGCSYVLSMVVVYSPVVPLQGY